MCLLNALTLQDAGTECTGEAIAGTNGISNLYLWSLLERLHTRSEDIAAVDTAGQHEHIEIILAENQPALVLDIQTWITEETADGNQLLIVNLQNIAALQTLGNHLRSIEVLTEIDVEDLQAILEYDRGTDRWSYG